MKRTLLLTIILMNFVILFGAQTDIKFISLQCESTHNPITVENRQPLFSWVMKSDKFNKSQSAYEIIVASSQKLLDKNRGDVWSSGKVASDRSAFVKFNGKALMPLSAYYWKVRVWDENKKVSEWSQAATFQTGTMDDIAKWNVAKWITLSKDSRTSEHRFREYKTGGMKQGVMVTSQPVEYFRKSENVNKEIESAKAFVCGLGYYELYINGKKVGDHLLDPAPSNYDKISYYVAYDVTDNLKKGANTLGIILGNGFYGQNISWKNNPEAEKNLAYGEPSVKMFVKVTYKDGTAQLITTDGSWKNSTGPIVFDNVYGGEIYDARFELNGWNNNGYNDSKWDNAKVVSPSVKKIEAQNFPAIRRLMEIAPVNVFKAKDGKWVVDFGQNISGWVRIKAKATKGKEVKIITTESLTKDKSDIYESCTGGGANGMAQWLKYIFKGEGTEEWEPRFTYHGFRYAKIDGLSEKPDAQMIKAVLVATDIDKKGSFECSDYLYNRMDTISRWTIVDNIHGIPEDCPHREKCGWLGDAHAFCEYALYNYDMLNFYKKYMNDISTQCKMVPGGDKSTNKYSVPTMIAPGRRTSSIAKLDWGVAEIYLPWYNYLHYGDDTMIKEHYKEMKSLTDYYLSFKDKDGIIQNGMGDWCPPMWDRLRNPSAMECNPIVSANAYFYDILKVMHRFAIINGDNTYAEKIAKETKSLFDAFNKVYLTQIPLTSSYWYGSQTATVMALQFGMVPEAKKKAVVNGLCYNIEAVKGTHHNVGIHGMRYIYTVLADNGKEELAYKILTTPTFPSQTYVMNYGFTTWPERQFYWDGVPEVSNSLNHPMHSGFAAYFYESLAGVKSSREKTGYKEFTINPVSPKEISFTNVKVPTVYGSIVSNWKKENGKMVMQIEVPFNTKAHLILSDSQKKSLLINNVTIDNAGFVYDSKCTNGITLGSGKYNVEYTVE